jgi:hypothetical protein
MNQSRRWVAIQALLRWESKDPESPLSFRPTTTE